MFLTEYNLLTGAITSPTGCCGPRSSRADGLQLQAPVPGASATLPARPSTTLKRPSQTNLATSPPKRQLFALPKKGGHLGNSSRKI